MTRFLFICFTGLLLAAQPQLTEAERRLLLDAQSGRRLTETERIIVQAYRCGQDDGMLQMSKADGYSDLVIEQFRKTLESMHHGCDVFRQLDKRAALDELRDSK